YHFYLLPKLYFDIFFACGLSILAFLISLFDEGYSFQFCSVTMVKFARLGKSNLKGEISSSISINFKDWLEEYGEGKISLPWYEIQT
ncbi:hypothetical protein R0K19_25030, partial [Bacillus sp. SIMBA_161]